MGIAAIGAGVAGSLIAVAIERFVDNGREKLEDLNRWADISEDLDALETEFQRALRESVGEEIEGPDSHPIVEAVEAWDPIVHELYEIESAAPTPETVEESDHDRLLFESETEAVERVVQAWGRAAGVDLSADPTLERLLRKVVSEAYPRAFEYFIDWVGGEDLAAVFEMETLIEIQTRLNNLAAEYEEPKVYKSLDEFRRSLFGEHRYVPVAAEVESERRLDDVSTESLGDAREGILELLNDGVDAIKIYGEGGSGKSRLLAAVGEVIREEDERDVYYVTHPEEAIPPRLERDTVLFVDDVGRKDMDYFVRRAARSERTETNQEYTVQVVVAARSVYKQTVKEILNELPQLSTSTLQLESMDDSHVRRLLEDFEIDFDISTTDYIVETSRGNPFFVTLLGQLVEREGSPGAGMRQAFEKVVGRMVGADVAAVSESEEDARRAFNALAVWQTYEEPNDADLLADVAQTFENRIARREWLRERVREQYLERRGSNVTDAKYSLRHDVLADYLRFEILNRGTYRDYAEIALGSDAPEIAEGLVELMGSPLRPFYSSVINQIREHAEWLSEAVFEHGCSPPTIFETEARIALAFPQLVPEERLDELFENYEEPGKLYDSIIDLLSVFLEHARTNPEWTRSYDHWTDRLDEIHSTTDDRVKPFARSLFNSSKLHGGAGSLEKARSRLNRLEELHAEYPDEGIREILAKAQMDAANYLREMGELEEMETRIDRLEELHTEYPDQSIRELLAVALFNATKGYGEAGAFEKAEAHLSDLERLHAEYSDGPVRAELAGALNSEVASHAVVESFGLVEERLDRLEELHAEYPEGSVRTELAKALKNTVAYYGMAGSLEELEARLDRLKNLHAECPDEHVRIELAEALVHAVNYYGEAEIFEEVNAQLGHLEQVHSTHPDDPIHGPLVKALFNAVKRYGEAGELKEVEARIGRLREIADVNGNFDDFEDEEHFLEIVGGYVLGLSGNNEELAISLIDTLREVLNETRWVHFCGEMTLELDKRYTEGEIPIDTYQKLVTHLS